eukprot:624750-Amphidinium_carterae.1
MEFRRLLPELEKAGATSPTLPLKCSAHGTCDSMSSVSSDDCSVTFDTLSAYRRHSEKKMTKRLGLNVARIGTL